MPQEFLKTAPTPEALAAAQAMSRRQAFTPEPDQKRITGGDKVHQPLC
jgi:hypothetical protein